MYCASNPKPWSPFIWPWIIFFAWTLTGCAPGPWATAPTLPHQVLVKKNVPLILDSGDEIKIEVWRHSDLERTLKIDGQGHFFYPLAGQIQARGKTVSQVRSELEDKLKKFFVSPQVNVTLTNLSSRKFYLLGEVKNPGSQILVRKTTIWEAIAEAGGLTTEADPRQVLLLRPKGSQVRAYPVNLLPDKQNPKKANGLIFLKKGDIVYALPQKIVSLERFMSRLKNIIDPLVTAERGVVLWPDTRDILKHGQVRTNEDNKTIIVAP